MKFTFWGVVSLVSVGFLAGYYMAKSIVLEQCYYDAERNSKNLQKKVVGRIDDLEYDLRHYR